MNEIYKPQLQILGMSIFAEKEYKQKFETCNLRLKVI